MASFLVLTNLEIRKIMNLQHRLSVISSAGLCNLQVILVKFWVQSPLFLYQREKKNQLMSIK